MVYFSPDRALLEVLYACGARVSEAVSLQTTGLEPSLRVLRLTGKGLPEFGGDRRGDLFLRLRVHLPEHLSREQRQLFERLRKLGGETGSGEETAT